MILGSISENANILLNFYDVTNFDDNSIAQSITLNKQSPFFEYTNIEETTFHYVITARFLNWFNIVNGKKYKAILSWINPNDSTDMQSVTYNWTMSLTAEQQQIVQDTTQQQINSGIQDLNNSINDTNNFLTNDNVNTNEIITSMPSESITADLQAETYLTNLFDFIRQAFTSENSQDFVFEIPNSNGETITIPANYIETHLPSSIIFLIRLVYWYIISRFILKDIWHTIDQIRQGDFQSGSDNDIKTEVL